MNKRLTRASVVEAIFIFAMGFSCLLVGGVLVTILGTVIIKGLPSLTWEMLTKVPEGGYYLGKGGGILNAIIGSIYLAGGGTILAFILGVPLALAIHLTPKNSRWVFWVRMALNILWGVPTIVFGAFGFAIMAMIGLRASLLPGILVLAVIELPIVALTIDEAIRLMPAEVEHAALAVGASRIHASFSVVLRQVLPGVATAALLAFGRGIGDAASVLFTAGYTDRIPESLLSPAASLPLAVFFQLSTPYPAVQQRAYTAALILTILVLLTSLGARLISRWLGRFIIR